MPTVPEKLPEAIDWVGVHAPVWTVAEATIGLEAGQLANLTALHAQADALKAEYEALKAQCEAKGAEYRRTARTMRSTASGMVVQIRGFARTTPDPKAVFAAARLPEPATRTPAPPPGTPTAFRVELLESGTLRFTFDCEHPEAVSAVTYKVLRQEGPDGPYQFLLNAKKRRFEDGSFSGSSGMVTYLVTAQTSTQDGNPAYFTVRFGGGERASIIAQGTAGERLAS
ncbi:MAG: hypothetical protein RIE32_00650 [Phycisphaerales bacterium]